MEETTKAVWQETLQTRYQLLEAARVQLKKEFFGIDTVIDQVIDNSSAWFLFPEVQEKPVIVNLWGLTGVGKSSLVKRLAQLIRYEQRFYQFDMGSKNGRSSDIRNKIENIYEYDNGFPIMLALDEFQYARTINEAGMESENSYSRIIWELLDSGKFFVERNYHDLAELMDLQDFLKRVQRRDFKIVKGIVKTKVTTFKKMVEKMGHAYYDDEDAPALIPNYYQDSLHKALRERFEDREAFDEALSNLTIPRILEMIEKAIVYVGSDREVDCSKSLIFVLGNLDEAYDMSGTFSPDMDADSFHKESLKITVPKIKNALQKRLRNEQIARLGNTHLIYPALNRAAYEKIIAKELKAVQMRFRQVSGLDITLDASLHRLIYQEGVYPTQGVRPVLTTIAELLSAFFGKVLAHRFEKSIPADSLRFSVMGKAIVVSFFENGQNTGTFRYEPPLRLKEIQENRRDDFQAIAAVHESGHAILAARLLGKIPVKIISLSSESEFSGKTILENGVPYTLKHEIMPQAAMMLGGFAAEKLIFGDENRTDGSDSDIGRTTAFIMGMLKNSGMGELPANYNCRHHETWNQLHDTDDSLNQLAETMIENALNLATETLENEYELLLAIADYLSDERVLHREQFLEFVKDYGSAYFTKRSAFSHRQHLKELAEKSRETAVEKAG